MSAPRITVLMPVYNGEQYLAEAIGSILTQTYRDFEFLIIDDGSTDNSAAIIGTYDDPRIRLVRNSSNMGVTLALNRGIELALGKYIARMDCDDISLPPRLEAQVLYMEKHPEVGVLGCRSRIVDQHLNTISEPERPRTHECIRWVLLFRPALIHSSVMFRTDIARACGGYSIDFPFTQDYELWSRLIKHTTFGQLPDTLVLHRQHSGNLGALHKEEKARLFRDISRHNIHDLIPDTELIERMGELLDYVRLSYVREGDESSVIQGLLLIYSTFMAKHMMSIDDRKWITSHLCRMILPLTRRRRVPYFLYLPKISCDPCRMSVLNALTFYRIYYAHVAVLLMNICKNRFLKSWLP